MLTSGVDQKVLDPTQIEQKINQLFALRSRGAPLAIRVRTCRGAGVPSAFLPYNSGAMYFSPSPNSSAQRLILCAPSAPVRCASRMFKLQSALRHRNKAIGVLKACACGGTAQVARDGRASSGRGTHWQPAIIVAPGR